ncbi:MAG: SAM-dependent methyltransferase [Thermoguttaceae bacterium]
MPSDTTNLPDICESYSHALDLAAALQRESVFARFAGISLGKIESDTNSGEDTDSGSDTKSDLAEKFWNQVAEQLTPQTGIDLRKIRYIHCFSRDLQQVGKDGFEPGCTPHVVNALQCTRFVNPCFSQRVKQGKQHCNDYAWYNSSKSILQEILAGAKKYSPQFQPGVGADRFDIAARENEIVLNLTQVDDNVFWLGLHRTGSDIHTRYAGGFLPVEIPSDMVSRAYLKFEEAIRWSGFPIGCGTRCVDIGSSPGGASQALLTRGAEVLGIDPAEMSPQILAFPNFTHLRGRVGQIKRKLLRNCKYAVADMNVAPAFTLEVLEELVHRPEINLSGLIFTLKLFQWELVEKLDVYLARIKSWGFDDISVKQLQFNRQEITIAAKR